MRIATSDDVRAIFGSNLATCKLVGQRSSNGIIEVLIRPKDAHGNSLNPHSFVQASVDCGLGTNLDAWVAAQVSKLVVSRMPEIDQSLQLSMNVTSASVINPEPVLLNLGILIDLELPEDLRWPENEILAISFCKQARKKGHRLSLDDFSECPDIASRWTALAPVVDTVKLDAGPRTWLQDVLIDPKNTRWKQRFDDLLAVVANAIELNKVLILERANNELAANLEKLILKSIGKQVRLERQDFEISRPQPLPELIFSSS